MHYENHASITTTTGPTFRLCQTFYLTEKCILVYNHDHEVYKNSKVLVKFYLNSEREFSKSFKEFCVRKSYGYFYQF